MRRKTACILTLIALVTGFAFLSQSPAQASSEAEPEGMFELYAQNRSKGIPNYITEDFLLLAYSMILNETVTGLEETLLYPEFRKLTDALIKKLGDQKPRDDIAKANLDYLNVLACLLSGKASADSEAANQELERIRKAGGIVLSDLMKQQIDYTQFKVRGKYTRSKILGQYFQAMKYAGTVLFPILESKATGITPEQADFLTQQSIGLVRLIQEDKALSAQFQKMESRFSWLFGPPDDMISKDYHEVWDKMKKSPVPDIRKALLDYARKQGCQPAIIGGMVDGNALEKGTTAKDVMTGWRFMPQRFTPDSAAFQQLVYNQVKQYQGKKKEPFSLAVINGLPVKGFPLGLELMALLGSQEAKKRLNTSGDQQYKGYEEAASKAGKVLTRSSGLSSDHLHIMQYWLTRGRTSEPKEDESRRLNTCLAFWTYHRYINILYAKQSYTVAAKSFNLPSERKTAWLEPAPELYMYLQRQVESLFSRLNIPGKEKSPHTERLKAFQTVLRKCREISFRELQGTALREADIAFLNDLDEHLLKLVGAEDQPIVVDVHTEPVGGKVLEEGLGHPQSVTKELEGKTKARGALFRYYEFKHPMQDRLTDAKWQLMLTDPKSMKKMELSPGSSVQ